MVNFELLINQQMGQYSSGLLVVDENIDTRQLNLQHGWQALTNRFDQQKQLLKSGWTSSFSDFAWPEGFAPEAIIYRISKEKAVVNHLINLAAEKLTDGAKFVLLGDRSEGIKSYSKSAQKRLSGDRSEKKLGGDSWIVELSVGASRGVELDDQDYAKVRSVSQVGMHSLLSKPGVYGWKKVDKGSEQLIQRLPFMLQSQLPLGNLTLLDLGSGSGYLSLAAAGTQTQISATDNNAAAALATRQTLQQAGMDVDFHFSDAGAELDSKFDLILCNPPFHSGFGVDYDLTDRFSKNAARLLKADGRACFVVNQHVPLKRIASNYFNAVELDQDSGSFCTYLLTKPKI